MSLRDLLLDALLDPGTADFTALRREWMSSERGDLLVRDEEALEELHLRLATDHYAEALDLVEELLERDPLDVELRLWCARCHEGLRDMAEASCQRAFANGLVRAALRSGDGLSPATALRVLHTREEHRLLRIMGLTSLGSELMEVDGRWIDRVEATGEQGARVVFFDVTLPEGFITPS